MKTYTVQNVLKVIDIHHSQLEALTINYLANFFVTYRDKVLKEDILNISEASEDCVFHEENELVAPKAWYTDGLKAEIAALRALADEHDAAYIRIIYS